MCYPQKICHEDFGRDFKAFALISQIEETTIEKIQSTTRGLNKRTEKRNIFSH